MATTGAVRAQLPDKSPSLDPQACPQHQRPEHTRTRSPSTENTPQWQQGITAKQFQQVSSHTSLYLTQKGNKHTYRWSWVSLFVLNFWAAVCLAQRQRTPSAAFAATATVAAVRRPPRRCTALQALLLAVPQPELTHSTTAHTQADVEATKHLVRSGVRSLNHLLVLLVGVFSQHHILCLLVSLFLASLFAFGVVRKG